MSKSNFVKKVAWRYFRVSRHGERLISIVSTISIIGVALGCFALVVTLSVLNGFQAEITSRVTTFEPAVMAEAFPMKSKTEKQLIDLGKQNSEIKYSVPLIERKAMVSSDIGNEVVYIKALSLNGEKYPMSKEIIAGSFDLGTKDEPKFVIGYQLADKIGVTVGDEIAIISPLEASGPFMTPPVIRGVVSGVFRAELFQYDDLYIFTNLAAGQQLFRLSGKFTGVEYYLHNFEKSSEVARSIESQTANSSLEINTWRERHQTLYNAMTMEKWGSLIALTLIIIVATFNLISSLVMLVLEKIQEIGILKTIGANDQMVQRIFLRQGWYVGGIGTAIGTLLGIGLVLFQSYTGFFQLPGDIYFINAVPVILSPVDVTIVVCISLLLSLLAAVYPAKQAEKLQPIEAISYEH